MCVLCGGFTASSQQTEREYRPAETLLFCPPKPFERLIAIHGNAEAILKAYPDGKLRSGVALFCSFQVPFRRSDMVRLNPISGCVECSEVEFGRGFTEFSLSSYSVDLRNFALTPRGTRGRHRLLCRPIHSEDARARELVRQFITIKELA